MKNKDIKKEKLLDTAFHLFIEKGYQSTKVVDIAGAAGMGKSTFYGYFESKDAIFAELFQTKFVDGYLQGLYDIEKLSLTSLERLEKMLLYDTDFIEHTGNFLGLFYEIAQSVECFNNHLVAKNVQELFSIRFDILRRVIAEGVEADQFINKNVDLLSVAIMGAFNLFLPVKLHFLTHVNSELEPQDLWELLKSGIVRSPVNH